LRGKNYVKDKKKIPAGESVFEQIGVDFFSTTTRNEHIAQWDESPYAVSRRNATATGVEAPFMLIVNWILPGKPRMNFVNYYQLKNPDWEPETEDDKMYHKMLWHFLTGPDKFRDNRFKFIPSLADGPSTVKAVVGSTPAIIGKKLQVKYFTGPDYLEIDIDIGSSTIAGMILGKCKGTGKQIMVDMAFTIEGKKEAELPERLLGVTRLCYPDVPECDRLGDPITGWTKFTPDTVYETN